jgi:hypothetical protein
MTVDGGREGFRVTYQPMLGKQSLLDYVCDRKAGVGELRWSTLANSTSTPYLWTFEWRSKYACPVGSGGGGDDSDTDGLAISIGWILLIWCVSLTERHSHTKSCSVEQN